MLPINKNHNKKHIQNHPRVKIYYLKNDPNNQIENNNYHPPITGPSISCLSSFIQKQKNRQAIDLHQQFISNFNAINQQPTQIQQHNITPNITRSYKTKPIDIETQNNPVFQTNKHTAYTTDLKPSTSPVNHHTVHVGFSHQKRFNRTSQQKYTANNQNNQALSKDFLSNMVKEWNVFSQHQKRHFKKTALNTRKRSIENHKVYRPQQIEQMKKNKFLMKEHFNLFLQNQKSKSTKKKQKSLTLLKAIFHRQDSESQISNKNIQVGQNMVRDTRPFKTQISMRGNRCYQKGGIVQRRFSLNQKSPKNKYFRLLYGPEVKLIPRLFEQKCKIKNFDWTKLDKKVYENKKKTKSRIQQEDDFEY